MQFSCADCGCVVDSGVRLALCADFDCCCASLPACDFASVPPDDVVEPVRGSTT